MPRDDSPYPWIGGYRHAEMVFARQVKTARMTGSVLTVVVLLLGGGLMFSGEPPIMLLGLAIILAATPTLAHLFRPFGENETADDGSLGSSFALAFNAIGIALLVALAAVVMFVVTCFPIGLAGFNTRQGDTGIYVAFAAGLASAGAIAYLIVRGFFRRRRPPL
jgi:hypothetical protein